MFPGNTEVRHTLILRTGITYRDTSIIKHYHYWYYRFHTSRYLPCLLKTAIVAFVNYQPI